MGQLGSTYAYPDHFCSLIARDLQARTVCQPDAHLNALTGSLKAIDFSWRNTLNYFLDQWSCDLHSGLCLEQPRTTTDLEQQLPRTTTDSEVPRKAQSTRLN